LLIVVMAVCLWCGVPGQAETSYHINLVDRFGDMPTQQLVASRESLEYALYNTIFDTEVFWQGLTVRDRRSILGKARQAISAGLGLRVVIPKAGKLENVEFQILPFDNWINQYLVIVTNLSVDDKGEATIVPLDSGVTIIFVLDGEHLALYTNYAAKQQLEEIEQKLAKNPKNKELLLAKASLYDMFDQREAVATYEEIIRLYPKEAVAYNNLAMLYTGYLNLNLLNPEKALQYAKKACALTKNKDVAFLDTLARAYYVNGELKKALDLTRENLAKDNQRVFHLFLEMLQARILGDSITNAENC